MSVLQEKKNCWKIASVKRGGFLIDAEAYFQNLYEALLQAKENIFILGWDLDTRTKLIPKQITPGIPHEFAKLLNYLLNKEKNLQIHLLIWNHYSILAFERELFIRFKLGWKNKNRLHFHLDSEYPLGATHHQKIVTIDDQIGFCGGIDITSERWDTSSHRKYNRLRKNHVGTEYEPQHDLQMMIEGEAANHLAELCRTRWERATNIKVAQKPYTEKNHRFDDLKWDFGEAKVAISRTEPAFKKQKEIREIEQLFLDLIKNTRHHLYIENQYFTSQTILNASQKSLSQKQGPEITLILPKSSAYWVENQTMGALQSIAIKKLRDSDRFHRLGIFCPVFNDDKSRIKVHSKIMICDDRYVRIGSANMSNRSLGLDTECDLTLDGSQKTEVKKSIRQLKMRLIAEHLNANPETVKNTPEKTWNEFIKNHPKNRRHLEEMGVNEAKETMLTQLEITDLKSPLEIDQIIDRFESDLGRNHLRFLQSIPFLFGTALGLLLLLLAVWNVIPFFEASELKDFFLRYENQKMQPMWVLFIFTVGGLLFVPVNILILATASLFSFVPAFLIAILGSLLNASVSYAVGNFLGKKTIQKFFFHRVNRLAKRMEQKGVFPIVIIRLLPIAPYSIVNFIAGAFKISFKNYLLGTCIGMMPGTIFLILFQRSLLDMIRSPSGWNIALFSSVTLCIIIMLYFLRNRLRFPKEEIWTNQKKRVQ